MFSFSVPSERYKSAIHAQLIRQREESAFRAALGVEEVDGGFRCIGCSRLGQGRTYSVGARMIAATSTTLAVVTWVREFLELFANRYKQKVLVPFRLYLPPDIVAVLKDPSVARDAQVESEVKLIRRSASAFESLCFLSGDAEQVQAGYAPTSDD